ncbi:MAG: PLP-dependent transferase [Planctomycetes bacterium]|nr:PLP-dependent transferase [Planctomycetota bacterium]
MTKPQGPSTTAIHGGEDHNKPFHSLTTPVVFSTAFPFSDNQELHQFFQGEIERPNEYARYGHPTIRSAEEKLAAIEGADDALLCSTGMAAITSSILGLVKSGSHIVVTSDSYRKTRVFIRQFMVKFQVEYTVCDPSLEAIQAACTDATRLIISETPTNPFLRCLDLEALAKFAKSKRIKTLIDSTFATSYNLKPLEYGIDLVIHSATKYLGGHNDIMAGVVLGKQNIIDALRDLKGMFGYVLGPMTAYLLIRGLKTFALRMRHFNESGQRIAEYLEAHPAIEVVHYPGLASHPDHEIAQRMMKGFGSVVSFCVKGDLAQTSAFIDALTIPQLGPTFGGPESMIGQPALVSYYDMAPEDRAELGISDNLVRFCIGLEDTDDIIADIEQALNKALSPAS